MKLKKRTAMITSFTIGILMFATTVMAEVASKSGYEQAKDALKSSAESFSNKLSNYTIDTSLVLKDNGKVIMSENHLSKCDRVKEAQENVDISTKGNNKIQRYYYRDKNMYITKNSQEDIYFVTKLQKPDSGYKFDNPFKEERAGDAEKIADALVGNLKDSVVVEDKSNGSKKLSGSVKEAQIPTIINAVSSYMLKEQTSSRNSNQKRYMPLITKDVHIKEVKGNMTVDKNGLIQNLFGTGTFYAKDDKGNEHNLTFELLFKVSNVNSTAVNQPNLSGKKVEKCVERNKDDFANPEKYVGKYKNNIVIEKDGKFQKIGERIVDITHSDNKTVSGTYQEKYLKGYEKYKGKVSQLKFDAKYDKDKYNARFNVENSSYKGNISINRNEANIYFDFPYSSRGGEKIMDGSFSRAFD